MKLSVDEVVEVDDDDVEIEEVDSDEWDEDGKKLHIIKLTRDPFKHNS
jgi:hypothetical protein